MNMNKASIMSRERKVTFLVLLMFFAFMVAWAPYATICLLRLIQGIKPTPATVAISMLCAKTSACINPIIFTLFNAQVNQFSFFYAHYPHTVLCFELSIKQCTCLIIVSKSDPTTLVKQKAENSFPKQRKGEIQYFTE